MVSFFALVRREAHMKIIYQEKLRVYEVTYGGSLIRVTFLVNKMKNFIENTRST